MKKKYAILLKKDSEEPTYILSITGANALFEIVPLMNVDRERPNLLRGTFHKKVFLNSKEILEQLMFNDIEYLISEPTNIKDWILTKEAKIILGYKTFKATITTNESPKRYIEAWYAPEIPLSLGPDGFEGLPGLILQIDYNNKKSLTAISLESVVNNFVFPPSQGKRISKKEFQEIMESFDAELQERYGN